MSNNFININIRDKISNRNSSINFLLKLVFSILIKIIIEPYLHYEECKNFIINCKELQDGLIILKEYNEEFIKKLKSNFSEIEKNEIKTFFNKLEKNSIETNSHV